MFDIVFIYSDKSPHPCHCAYVYHYQLLFISNSQPTLLNNDIWMRMSPYHPDRMFLVSGSGFRINKSFVLDSSLLLNSGPYRSQDRRQLDSSHCGSYPLLQRYDYIAEILPRWRYTPINQSINQSMHPSIIYVYFFLNII